MNQSSDHVVGKVHEKLPPPPPLKNYPNPNPYTYPNLEENLLGPILRGAIFRSRSAIIIISYIWPSQNEI